eukprot:TRINITY_DN2607_c0_g1_i1.p1 TRINITY_DN2607_c0_g1~~TRINITY_DN2607_c0_g1_i1.p1  ORF type:complete len:532 (-),score=181.21 TRINITY_DN2607_c0_g1_i1:88-1683(-)
MTEFDVAAVEELKDGEMKEVAVDGAKILLSRVDGEFFATSHQCSHYNAPLAKGVLVGSRVRCPWHGACFDVKTGDIEDAPTVGCLVSFPVRVDGGRVFVSGTAEQFKERRRIKTCGGNIEVDASAGTAVIVGGGAAGLAAASSLRENGYRGRVVMLSRESVPPYDRVKCSKALSVKLDSILLRPAEWYQENAVELRLGVWATGVDTDASSVALSDGSAIAYTDLVLAPGADARRLPVPGFDSSNVFTIRTIDDAHALNSAAPKGVENVVILGLSFIATEAAAIFKSIKKAQNVTMCGFEKVPLERVLGPAIGMCVQRLHEKKDVKFEFEAGLDSFEVADGKVTAVKLNNGKTLPADIVIVGIGAVCNTGFIRDNATLAAKVDRDGGVRVNEFLQVVPHVYAVGDIARYPYHLTGEMVRVEHWGHAEQQGRICAQTICGNPTPFRSVPFFWSVQYGKSFRYTGHALSYEETVVQGSLEENTFVAFLCKGEQILAVVTLGTDPAAAAAAELFHLGKMPRASQVRGGLDLLSLV